MCAILDYNGLQIDGRTADVMNIEPVVDKWTAFGWNTIEIDGHNMGEILSAYEKASDTHGKPSIIIAHTIKAKAYLLMENVCNTTVLPQQGKRRKGE